MDTSTPPLKTIIIPMGPPHVKRQRTQPPNTVMGSSTKGNKKQDIPASAASSYVNADGVLIIPRTSPKVVKSVNAPVSALATPLPANTKTIELIDIRETRRAIIANWRGFTPAEIVRLHKLHYINLRSAAVMLSRLKQELGSLEDSPPDEEYLSKLCLSKKEYNEIRKLNQDVRKRGSLDVVTVSCGDAIVLQALQYITSSDPNLLFASLLVLTGARPIEIAKVAQYKTNLNNVQQHPAFWACQSKFAKRGTMISKYNECRDRPFLAPYWLIERALVIVRKRWPCRGFDNKQISRKYSTQWQKILAKAYTMLPGITARICRRFFACYSFHYFGKSVFVVGGESSQSSLNGYASWVLGHASLEDQVIAYSSLIIRPAPKLRLFEVGKNLKVIAESSPKMHIVKTGKSVLDKSAKSEQMIDHQLLA